MASTATGARAAQPIGPVVALLLMPLAFLLVALAGTVALRWGLVGVAVAQVAAFALPAWLAARRPGPPAAVLALVRPPGRALVGGLLLAVSFWYLSAALLAPLVEDLVTERETELLADHFFGPEPLAVKLAVLALVPALCEEILVRGAIARGLRPRLGLFGAALLSSIYFAALHGSLARLPITFLLGIVLAVATLRSGSLVPAILIHAGNNAAAVLLTQPQLAGAAELLGQQGALALPVAALASGIGLALVWRSAPPGSD
jgi:membrane protease YdiL (CAAX protease family)